MEDCEKCIKEFHGEWLWDLCNGYKTLQATLASPQFAEQGQASTSVLPPPPPPPVPIVSSPHGGPHPSMAPELVQNEASTPVEVVASIPAEMKQPPFKAPPPAKAPVVPAADDIMAKAMAAAQDAGKLLVRIPKAKAPSVDAPQEAATAADAQAQAEADALLEQERAEADAYVAQQAAAAAAAAAVPAEACDCVLFFLQKLLHYLCIKR